MSGRGGVSTSNVDDEGDEDSKVPIGGYVEQLSLGKRSSVEVFPIYGSK